MKRIVRPKTGIGLRLRRGESLRVIDPEGQQVADLVAFDVVDSGHWLCSGRTFDYNATIRLTRGHILYSNRSVPMLTILDDTVGRHDFCMRRAAGRCSGSSMGWRISPAASTI